MGYKDYQKRIPLLGAENNALTWLVIINISVFVILNFIKIVYHFSEIPIELYSNQILDWFSLPASIEKLSSRPWVVVLYMFSHLEVWGLISSLLWLWAFGYILQDLTGNTKLFPIYLYGGFVGAVFFLLSNNLFAVYARHLDTIAPMLGGSAAVMAIAVATTTLAPDYRIFPLINGGIPLWVLTVLFVAIDFATIASASGSIAIAHLAGGGMGFLYIKQLGKGNDLGSWMLAFMDWIDSLFNPEKKNFSKHQKDKIFYKTSEPTFKKTPNITQKKLDDILDKINQEGYHMLTDEEKTFLKKASKEEL